MGCKQEGEGERSPVQRWRLKSGSGTLEEEEVKERLNSEMKSDKVKGHRKGIRQVRGHREECGVGPEVTGE